MIDQHAHLRDGKQSHKETVKHGLDVAYRAGLDGVFEMPNTDPPLTSRVKLLERMTLQDEAIARLEQEYEDFKMFIGMYAGLTADPRQMKDMVKAYNELFPRVVGLKMFAGNSTGNMGIIEEYEQELVYKILTGLGYKGVLAVHCEKESEMKPELWNPEEPYTHTLARAPEAEIESIEDQIRFAKKADYKGTLHICHISVPEALELIEQERKNIDFRITCELTPHHAVLYDKMMDNENGLLLKMNPALRTKEMQEYMLKALVDGRINSIASDHAPHTLEEKMNPDLEKPHASGIPGFPYLPYFIKLLRKKGMSQEQIDAINHNNIVEIFGIDIPNSHREPNYDLAKEYEFNAFDNI